MIINDGAGKTNRIIKEWKFLFSAHNDNIRTFSALLISSSGHSDPSVHTWDMFRTINKSTWWVSFNIKKLDQVFVDWPHKFTSTKNLQLLRYLFKWAWTLPCTYNTDRQTNDATQLDRQSSELNTNRQQRNLIHYRDDEDKEWNGRVVGKRKKSIAMGD